MNDVEYTWKKKSLKNKFTQKLADFLIRYRIIKNYTLEHDVYGIIGYRLSGRIKFIRIMISLEYV